MLDFQTLDQEYKARAVELLPLPPAKEYADPQIGDYPVITTNSQLLPAKGWWNQQARRNFGDPVSLDTC
jgi:hypothetical protein